MGVGKVNCDNNINAALCQQFEIKTYPTLILLQDSIYLKYKGSRNFKDLESFVTSVKNNSEGEKISIRHTGVDLYLLPASRFIS